MGDTIEKPDFRPIFNPTKQRPLGSPPPRETIIKDAFRLRTLMAMGALAQIVLFAILPYRYAVVPALIFVLQSIGSTIGQLLFYKTNENPFMTGVVQGLTSGQPPSWETGRYPNAPCSSPIVVFHLGVSYNHPLGPACPGGKEVYTHFMNMISAMNEKKEEYGLLGMSNWKQTKRATHNAGLVVMYFKSVEGLHKFAHDKEHRDGWDFLHAFRKKGYNHITALHETFEVPAGAWESIYLDSPPILMGDTSIKVTEKDGSSTWYKSLVDASVRPLTGMMNRMARGKATARESTYAY
ncbi:hypothetical protein SMACR_03368 [Sordaria macrospora]|uniref:WGS project CABT00000000 data, contig 2.10 n=2 Tax=Sordaria macrospora TaxID=5147 RepID=F7VWP4_SORMK|nr:uncharacterized protein SMAC_03368 [Sordaria macrospora k-hell]KAA8632882.1 hypothetical protein SMACR_03368 [Sordaria macrospora]WPJ66673.1 hypothetical protein SMAC4_03368 [Sordaria macrospora]CCC09812.1 unnamed protein product [Sordaria macrospora k-hell]